MVNLNNHEFGNCFLGMIPKVQIQAKKTDMLNFIKIENFMHHRILLRKSEKTTHRKEKIFATTSDKL